jgi:hypothetical protein
MELWIVVAQLALVASAVLGGFNAELLVLSSSHWAAGIRSWMRCSSRCGVWRTSVVVLVAHHKRYSVAANIDRFQTWQRRLMELASSRSDLLIRNLPAKIVLPV